MGAMAVGCGRSYYGTAPCLGCGRTGEERHRKSKDSLCDECQKYLAVGRAVSKERELERCWYRMDDLCNARMTYNTIHNKEIGERLKTLLGTFSEFQQGNAGKFMELSRPDATSGSDTFVLPVKTFEAAKELVETIGQVALELDEDKRTYQEQLKKEAAAELAEQKNAIYNEGVAHGRNLLMQLNNNEITADEFTRPVKRF